jgi:replicative DNA helicase
LSRSLNGLLPALYLFVGRPSSGKSAFARQLCDQVACENSIPAIFFGFGEAKKDLRIRTLARLSGVEGGEIRKGSGFLLHWYGVPKARTSIPAEMVPSWDKLKKAAEEAGSWLDLIYLFEADKKTDFAEIEEQIGRVREMKRSERLLLVIDDSQSLGRSDLSLDARLPLVTEQLQGIALNLRVPVVATWPDLKRAESSPEEWGERVAAADVVLVFQEDAERTKRLTEPNRAIDLHIVKNRGGERGRLAFDFMPAFSKFAEASLDSPA